jgi:hypothetical protein
MTVWGSFEPGFYGITLVHDDDSSKLLRSYSAADDVSRWSRLRGQDLTTIGMISAPEHEVRHFHDFLLSPAGAGMMALQIEACWNGMQAISLMRQLPQRAVPVPVARWLDWDQAARDRWVQSTGRHFGIDDAGDFIPLPTPDERELQAGTANRGLEGLSPVRQVGRLAEATVLNFLALAELRESRDFGHGVGSFSADDVFEGSAHLVQAQAIWNGQGAEANEQYLAHLEGGMMSHHRTFGLLLKTVRECDAAVPLSRMAELYTWMMLGSDDLLGKGNPATRCAVVHLLARRDPKFVGAMVATEHLWAELDRVTGQSWRKGLQESIARLESKRGVYLESARSFTEEFQWHSFYVANLWLDDSLATARAFLSDPVLYTQPLLYLRYMVDRLPVPYLRHHFNFDVRIYDEPAPSDWRTITFADQPKEVISVVRPLNPNTVKILVDSVYSTMMLNFFVEYCFFGEPPDCLLNRYLAANFKATIGKEIVHVY